MKIAPFAKVEPSLTVTINTLAAEKRLRGQEVYNLSVGDPMLLCHPKIMESAIKHTANLKMNYPVVEGIPELRKLAVDWMNTTYQSGYDIQNTIVTCGGKFVIYAACQALLEAGDEVLVPSPYWVSFPEIVKLFGGVPKVIPSTVASGWKITGDDIRRHATPKTRMIIFNNACNPTGAVYDRDEVEDVLRAAKEKGIVVLADEVYSAILYRDKPYVSCSSFHEHHDNIITVQSCSKNFGMTGWRVGFAFAPTGILKIINNLQGQCTTGTSLISQWGAVGALENASEVSGYVRNALFKRRQALIETYKELFGHAITPPDSAMYVLVPISDFGATDNDSVKFANMIMDRANVAVVPGAAFGAEGFVRLSFSETEENIVKALRKLATFLSK